jgi:ribosomal protein L11 methyltransferase
VKPATAEPAYTRYTLRRDRLVADIDAQLDDGYLRAREALRALGVTGWQESDDAGELVFWLPVGAGDGPAASEALARLGACGALTARAEQPGWQDRWRRFHQPVAIGDLWIRPPWHEPREGFLDVVIDVGMAFGTGAHATTRQCLEALCWLPRGSLLDLGTGSGVLALAGLRLGFAPVVGLDVDEIAVAAAAANARRNGLAPTFIAGDVADSSLALPPADIVVANLALAPILALGARYQAANEASREAGGDSSHEMVGDRSAELPRHLLLAGLLESQAAEAVAAFPAYEVRERLLLDEWILVHLVMPA